MFEIIIKNALIGIWKVNISNQKLNNEIIDKHFNSILSYLTNNGIAYCCASSAEFCHSIELNTDGLKVVYHRATQSEKAKNGDYLSCLQFFISIESWTDSFQLLVKLLKLQNYTNVFCLRLNLSEGYNYIDDLERAKSIFVNYTDFSIEGMYGEMYIYEPYGLKFYGCNASSSPAIDMFLDLGNADFNSIIQLVDNLKEIGYIFKIE